MVMQLITPRIAACIAIIVLPILLLLSMNDRGPRRGNCYIVVAECVNVDNYNLYLLIKKLIVSQGDAIKNGDLVFTECRFNIYNDIKGEKMYSIRLSRDGRAYVINIPLSILGNVVVHDTKYEIIASALYSTDCKRRLQCLANTHSDDDIKQSAYRILNSKYLSYYQDKLWKDR